ncbi:MAG: HAMP domain-containing protein, partial [Nitrospinota bacterium]
MSRFSSLLSLLTVRLWRDLKVRTRLFLLIVMFLGLYLLFSLGGFYTLERLKIGGELYQQIKRYKDTIETITLLKSDLNESRMLQLSILEETDKAEIEAVQEEIKEISTYIDEDLATLLHQLPDGVIRVALRDAFVTWQDFKETREQQVFPALLAGNVDQARALVEDTQSLRYERFIEQIDSAIDAMRLKIEEIEKQVEKAVQQRITLLGAVTGGFMLLLVPVSLLLIHSITNPLQKMATVAHQLASGNIDQQVDYKRKN